MILFLIFPPILTLSCYSGTSYTPGGDFADKQVDCSSSQYCYNATADISVTAFRTGGCGNSYLCMAAKDKCVQSSVLGFSATLCCCSIDGCNSARANMNTLEKGASIFRDVITRIGNQQSLG
ncbi:unnamed protein product, partial [Mesorhabditis belari]|uniref:Uncharacterized protein n=1 Tax=Mesorhabditis belari TaxID=2138241 RepID=A0AAF3ECU4_9BILA